MGNSEEGKSTKTEKPSSPVAVDQANQGSQPNIHVYPDWAAMQAYYGPRVSMPPYYNPAVSSGHPHPYMWPPQPMMPPPYGTPYAAIYSHGGVYPHPSIPIGPQSHGQGVPTSPAAATPLNMETPTKSSGNADQGLMKKLKGFDGLAMSIGNGNAESADRGAENRLSQSLDTESYSDGSDSNTAGANQASRKRSREGTPATDGDGKSGKQANPVSKGAGASNKMTSITPANVGGAVVGPVVSSGMTTALELRNPSVLSKSNSPSNPQPCAVVPPEAWIQNERELKRERRKQSNRESARRSRLRKQAETEELARKVESLTSENITLKSEINRLTESSGKLKMENEALMEKLKNARGEKDEIFLTPSTENLLSRVNNSSSCDNRTIEGENALCEKKPNSGAKLHQLLDTSPRTDAVAAG
ncbi:common plant regulatory factor 1 isoform X2 [Neltuma alba]|uniref:common plant regulatory factor 1 isoform X2 n=1 Tax=Neltuma alba TaxID=207710 RepID=UPI0010A344DC|nr:common plant regulatory factor 1 isoform X2 [Prosopis alba]